MGGTICYIFYIYVINVRVFSIHRKEKSFSDNRLIDEGGILQPSSYVTFLNNDNKKKAFKQEKNVYFFKCFF